MAFLYETDRDGAVITGYEGSVSHLQIPEEIGGLPVRVVAKSAFARRGDLLYVRLPSTLCRLEKFAFYSCSRLEKVVLSDSVTDYHDGVFRLCGSLREIELTVTGERFTILKELLGDGDGTRTFLLHLPRGDARLTFPDYLVEYQEDTRARVIHSSILGGGYAYRECVRREGIDFSGYDHCFSRICVAEIPLSVRIALDRLLAPYELRRAAAEQYRDFLRAHDTEAVCLAVEERREDWLALLAREKLLSPAAADAGIRAASGRGLTAFVSALMHAAPQGGGRGGFRL